MHRLCVNHLAGAWRDVCLTYFVLSCISIILCGFLFNIRSCTFKPNTWC